MPTVLVINPYATDFKLYDEWMHPLGLYFLITILKGNGCDVRYFNCLERDRGDPGKKYNTGEIPSVEIEKPALYRSLQLFEHYAAHFPELRFDPLWHNDMFFVTRLPGWNWDAVEQIRMRAKDLASLL